MKFVNAIMTDNSVVMVFDEGTKVCSSSHPAFEKVKTLILRNKTDEALAEFDVTLRLKKHPNGQFFVDNGIVYMDNANPIPMPEALSTRVIQFANAGLNFKPLINLWNNIQNNAYPESVKDLYAFLEFNNIPVTEDGCFCAYKSVGENYLSLHEGMWEVNANGEWELNNNKRYDNTPGKRVSMPRDKVDNDRDMTCSSGLHVAAYEYAYGFSGAKKILVKVNPADVVSVPTDYNGQKMRTCGYDVIKDVTEEIKVPLYTSDDDWQDDYDDDDSNYGNDDDWQDSDDWRGNDDDTVDVPTLGIQVILPDKSGRVCVPSAYVKALGLKPGQVARVYLEIDGTDTNNIHITSTEVIDPEYQYVVDRDSNIRLSKSCIAASRILVEYKDIHVEIVDNKIVLS